MDSYLGALQSSVCLNDTKSLHGFIAACCYSCW